MSVNNNKRITKAARYNAKKINYDRIATSYRNIHICGILSIDKHMTNYTMSYRRHLLLSKGNYVNVCLPLIGQHSKTPFTNEKPFETPPPFGTPIAPVTPVSLQPSPHWCKLAADFYPTVKAAYVMKVRSQRKTERV